MQGQDLAAEQKGVAGQQGLEEAVLDLAEHTAAPADGPGCGRAAAGRGCGAGAHKAHAQHGGFDDGADIHPILLGDAAVRHPPAAILGLANLSETLVGAQRIAAVGHESDCRVELLAHQPDIGGRVGHLVVEFIRVEGCRAGHPENMLGQHIKRADALHGRVLHPVAGCQDSGPAFEHLEAVRRHQDGARGLIETVVGTADPLDETARPLGRPDIDTKVDIAPIDAEIERRGRHHGFQAAVRHGGFHLPALADVERAMVERDRQVVGVDLPQVPEQLLGLKPGVDEEQRQLGGLDGRIDLADRMPRAVAGPWKALLRIQHGDLRRRPFGRDHQRRRRLGSASQIGEEIVGLADGRRQPDGLNAGRQAAQAGEIERQEVATFRGDQRMQLVEHDAPEIGEEGFGIGARQEQRQLLRGRQQDVGRNAPLTLSFRSRGIAGAGLDADVEFHLGHGGAEVARDIHRQGLQRRNVERVQPGNPRWPRRQFDQARQEAARVLPAPVGAISSALWPASARASSST